MAVFKCKMCGGTIEFEQGATVGICDSCGTKQTLPRLDDDRKANLYDRANHFRRNNDFDKAVGIYEQILNEDNTDAEAYWSLVLCRYGIEYVEDPATHRRMPTVNRAQFTSIYMDEDYKSALKYADGAQRAIYEEEAEAIDDIQKSILAISSKEAPFDVFICYKETDTNGRRTQDSVLANELYHQLTQEGFKVFFSRITLEDKLGTAYEPYIFAALNSSKVMVVLGTKQEYFNAVWVKNEWSRYLAMVKNSGGKKMLIPAYKDMDPYDLPEEFSHLQAQDMSKLGFMQDLIRGIKKIIAYDAHREPAKENGVTGSATNAEPLLKRAFMFLEDGNWKEADAYCEKVLDQDPENAQAYLGKLMAELRVRKQESLKDCKKPFDNSGNYQKALRFADSALANEMRGYIFHINKRKGINELTAVLHRLIDIYNTATEQMNTAKSSIEFQSAAKTFGKISRFMDADKLAGQCMEKAEVARKDYKYNSAKSQMSFGNAYGYKMALAELHTISGWRDAEGLIAICEQKIREIEKAEKKKQIEEKKKRARTIVITVPTVCACIMFAVILIVFIIPNNKYNTALDLMENANYDEAISAFEELDGYKDSDTKIKECNTAILDIKYDNAVALMNEGDVIGSYESLIELNGYKDSAEIAEEIYNQYKGEKLKIAEIGDTVFWGTYEQDNNLSNGKEKIEWLVLSKEYSKLLIISNKVLDGQQFNEYYSDTTWESCSLRNWLNSIFLYEAFTPEEQSKIEITNVSADENPIYNTNQGNPTMDKIFLLSIPEAEKYFASDEDRKCAPTEYAIKQGVIISTENSVDDGVACWWTLRSLGDVQTYAFNARVRSDGSIDNYGVNVYYSCGGVRPAMWINLDD